MKPKYLYISGLGDGLDWGRRLMALWLRVYGRDVSVIPMKWRDKSESFEDKRARLMTSARRYHERDVILIGESAGGAMAISALAEYPDEVSRVVTVCGYNQGRSGVHAIYERLHPAFVASVASNDKCMDNILSAADRITTIYSDEDGIVKKRFSVIKGAFTRKITGGHQRAIISTMLFRPNLWK